MLDNESTSQKGGKPVPREKLGRYELIARIADGGMAEVHLARQVGPMNFQKVVVLKKIHSNLARQKEFIGMLLDEARISALIKHPRVVDIYDLGVSRGTYFIAMEYLAGQPLTAVITRGRRATPLDVYSTARIVADAAEGLHAAHNLKTHAGRSLELVHRDVSPSNIIVLYDGGVKLVDFGVAKARGRITETNANQIKGKVGYVSPEQIMENPVDRRSDVFSLGVVMWESLALRRLFDAESEAGKLKQILDGVPLPPSAHRPEVPYELDTICLRALSVNADDRFQSAQEMQEALESFLRDANYRREAGAISRFMRDTFAEERKTQEEQLRSAVIDMPGTRPSDDDDSDTLVRDGSSTDLSAQAREARELAEGSGKLGKVGAVLVPKPSSMSRPVGKRKPIQDPETTRRLAKKPAPVAKAQPPADKESEETTRPVAEVPLPRSKRPVSRVTGETKIEGRRVSREAATVPAGKRPSLDEALSVAVTKTKRPRRDTESEDTAVPRPRGKAGSKSGRVAGPESLRSTGRLLPLPAPPPGGAAAAADGDESEDEVLIEMEADDPVDYNDVTEVESGEKHFPDGQVGLAGPAELPPPAAEDESDDVVAMPAAEAEMPTALVDGDDELLASVKSRFVQPRMLAGVALGLVAVVALAVGVTRGGDKPKPAEEPLAAAVRDGAGSAPIPAAPAATSDEQSAKAEQNGASEPDATEPVMDFAAGQGDVAEVEDTAAETPADDGDKGTTREAARVAPRRAVKDPRPTRPNRKPPPTRTVERQAPAPVKANPGELYRDGAKLYLKGDLSQAAQKFRAALAAAPRYAPAHRGLGMVYERGGNKAKAIRSLETYLRLSPNAKDAQAIRARIGRLR